jgi:hypothetical protein
LGFTMFGSRRKKPVPRYCRVIDGGYPPYQAG